MHRRAFDNTNGLLAIRSFKDAVAKTPHNIRHKQAYRRDVFNDKDCPLRGNTGVNRLCGWHGLLTCTIAPLVGASWILHRTDLRLQSARTDSLLHFFGGVRRACNRGSSASAAASTPARSHRNPRTRSPAA